VCEPADEDRSCRQCDATVDGSERCFTIDGKPIWLHLECRAYRQRAKEDDLPW
jgi:hypothetical protein